VTFSLLPREKHLIIALHVQAEFMIAKPANSKQTVHGTSTSAETLFCIFQLAKTSLAQITPLATTIAPMEAAQHALPGELEATE